MPRTGHNIPDPGRENVADNLFRHFLYLIATGKWPEGKRLPSIRQIEELFGASRTSVQQAYQMLVVKQLVEAKPRSGYVVKKQPGDAWISRHRKDLMRLFEQFSKAILKTTGLAPLPVFRYLAKVADIQDHEQPSCAFVECTSLQAEGHAAEIEQRLGVSILPKTTGEIEGQKTNLPSYVRQIITSHFHHAELLPLLSKSRLEVIAVPIEVSPLLRQKIQQLPGPFVFLETEKQMARDIAEDAKKLMSNLPITTIAVDNIHEALYELLDQPPSGRRQPTTVLLSPRDWGSIDEVRRNHPHVEVICFSICESAWDTIAEFLGMPIGPLR